MPRTSVKWRVGLWWTGATAVGVAVGMTAGTRLAGVIGPATLGLLQWLVLRRHISQASWWILATTVGGVLGLYVGSTAGFFVGYGLTGVVAGAIGGTILGLAQWLVLRRHFSEAGLWILASCVALTVGAGWVVDKALGSAVRSPIDASPYFIQMLRWGGIGAASGAIGGAIKGGVLVWLLWQPKKSEREED
jgi:hypothetical protein